MPTSALFPATTQVLYSAKRSHVPVAGGPVVMTPGCLRARDLGAALRTGFVTHQADITVHYGFEPNSTACALRIAPLDT